MNYGLLQAGFTECMAVWRQIAGYLMRLIMNWTGVIG